MIFFLSSINTILCGDTEEKRRKALVFGRGNCMRARETMDVSEPGVSCWFGSLTKSSMLAAAPSADSRISILAQCSLSVRSSRTNVGGHKIIQATDFFFIRWNTNLGSLKSYVYYTHSSYSHSFSAAFLILFQLSKASVTVPCNTKHFHLS